MGWWLILRLLALKSRVVTVGVLWVICMAQVCFTLIYFIETEMMDFLERSVGLIPPVKIVVANALDITSAKKITETFGKTNNATVISPVCEFTKKVKIYKYDKNGSIYGLDRKGWTPSIERTVLFQGVWVNPQPVKIQILDLNMQHMLDLPISEVRPDYLIAVKALTMDKSVYIRLPDKGLTAGPFQLKRNSKKIELGFDDIESATAYYEIIAEIIDQQLPFDRGYHFEPGYTFEGIEERSRLDTLSKTNLHYLIYGSVSDEYHSPVFVSQQLFGDIYDDRFNYKPIKLVGGQKEQYIFEIVNRFRLDIDQARNANRVIYRSNDMSDSGDPEKINAFYLKTSDETVINEIDKIFAAHNVKVKSVLRRDSLQGERAHFKKKAVLLFTTAKVFFGVLFLLIAITLLLRFYRLNRPEIEMIQRYGGNVSLCLVNYGTTIFILATIFATGILYATRLVYSHILAYYYYPIRSDLVSGLADVVLITIILLYTAIITMSVSARQRSWRG